jgi:hypothetical protein
MTDPLTGKELVQKSYEYIDRLTKECGKMLLEDYNKQHKKFEVPSFSSEISKDMLKWFEKRDKNVHLSFEQGSVTRPSPNQFQMRFKGNTKDSDFVLNVTNGVFIPPGSETNEHAMVFLKSLAISADKNSFGKRKA